MSADLAQLKAAVPLETIVLETHLIDHRHRVICPVHDDKTPSCVVYPDHVFCYSCRWRADAIGWLMAVHDLTFAEALNDLGKRTGAYVPASLPKVSASPKRTVSSFGPVTSDVLITHRLNAVRLGHIPRSLARRGFTLADLQSLDVAVYGEDVVIPITDPNGRTIALKRRYAVPKPCRYSYVTKGCGSPAWCSPGFLENDEVLAIEGELNGCAAWLARPEIAVMGVAGANGRLHLEALKGRVVYVYTDGDEPGQKARDRWAAQALDAGARRVFVLESWPADACDLAGTQGRLTLALLLEHSLKSTKPVQRSITCASPLAGFFTDGDGAKSDLCKRATGVWDRAHRRLI